jgi:hypothetical protein
MNQYTTISCRQISRIHATNTGAQEKQNINLATATTANDKAVSHFDEIANRCREEGFGLIEDLALQEA